MANLDMDAAIAESLAREPEPVVEAPPVEPETRVPASDAPSDRSEEELLLRPETGMATQPAPGDVEPTWGEASWAGLKIQNPFYGWHLGKFEEEDGYLGPMDPNNEGYPAQAFAGSVSPAESAFIRNSIDEEREARQTLFRAGGLKGFLGEMAGVASNPLMYAGGAAVSLTKMIATEVIAEGVSEFLLQQQQVDRTRDETYMNLLGAGLGAMVFGKLGLKFTKKEIDEGAKNATQILRDMDADVKASSGGTAGAMRSYDPQTTMAEEEIIGGSAMAHLAIGPAAAIAKATSLKAKQLFRKLVDPFFLTEGGKQGKGGVRSIESSLTKYEGMTANALNTLQVQHTSYKKAGGGLSFNDFDNEVGKALYAGDRHVIKEVAEAARDLRKNFDEITEVIQDLDLLPKDLRVKFAESYRPRIYNLQKLDAHLPWLIDRVTKSVAKSLRGKMDVVVEYPDGFVAVMSRDLFDDLPEASQAVIIKANGADEIARESDRVARQVVNHVYTKTKDATKTDPGIGMLMERKLPIPDDELEKVLENRASVLSNTFNRNMGKVIETTKRFDARNIKAELQNVADEYSELAMKATTEKARKAIRKESEKIQKILQDSFDATMGTFGRPERFKGLHATSDIIRTANMLSMLGGVTLSSIPDLARPMARYGLMPYMKGIGRIATGMSDLSKADQRTMGIGVSNLRAGKAFGGLVEIGEHEGETSRKMMDMFSKLSLMTYWNDGLKHLTAEIGAHEMAKWIKQGSKLSKTKKALLQRAGLSSDMQTRIGQQIEMSGSVSPARWVDREAAAEWGMTLRSEADQIIIAPGVADLPLVMRTPLGRFMFQFKSFLLAAHNKMLVQGMQQADASQATGLLFAVTLGTLVTATKDSLRGKDLSDKEMHDWILDSVDRTGTLGALMLPINTARVAFGDKPSRMISQGITGNLTGPGMQTIEDVGTVAFAAMRGEADEKTAQKIAKHVPLQNLLHWREILSQMGDDSWVTAGVQRKKKR